MNLQRAAMAAHAKAGSSRIKGCLWAAIKVTTACQSELHDRLLCMLWGPPLHAISTTPQYRQQPPLCSAYDMFRVKTFRLCPANCTFLQTILRILICCIVLTTASCGILTTCICDASGIYARCHCVCRTCWCGVTRPAGVGSAAACHTLRWCHPLRAGWRTACLL